MKIAIWKTKGKIKFIHIYRQFYTKEKIISIGSDCHSAYILNSLNLRKNSYIFDWLYTNSKYGIDYVDQNINNNFSEFLNSLTLNHRNHIISENFPSTEFFHEKNLLESKEDRNKLQKRALRFLDLIKIEKCTFLYVINPEHFKNKENVTYFVESIHRLFITTDNRHKIKIFIKCKQDTEDFKFIDLLISNCKSIPNVNICKYHLDTNKYGIWGNSKDYLKLFMELKINVKTSIIPKIYIK